MNSFPPRDPPPHEIEPLIASWNAGDMAASERIAIMLTQRYPGHFLGWKALGLIWLNAGRVAQAIQPLAQWARILPDDVEAHVHLGNAHKDLGQLGEAGQCYVEALRIQPDFAEMHNNVGNVLRELGYPTRAQAHYREALRLKPDFALAYGNLGNALSDVGQFAEAEHHYRTALQLQPDLTDVHSSLLFCQNYLGALPVLATVAEARRYGAHVSARAVPKFTSRATPQAPERLRIGFVSGNFNAHPVGYFAETLFARLDPAQFELVAFPTNLLSDALTDRIRPRFCDWVPIFGLSDHAAAAVIHQRGIHILIDLAGHSSGNRLPVFAYRPAPVQAAWLGYFATTGLPEMDWLVGDPHMLPNAADPAFTETPCPLPETWFCMTPPPAIAIGTLPALANGYVTFGCFGNLAKMNAGVVEQWTAILQAVPQSRLMLKAPQLGEADVCAQIRALFAAHGVDGGRLILDGHSPREAYLACYNRIDMVLDTFPYPGGTTSVEALWMGVPVLTLHGDTFLGRLGVSVAHNAGQADWIASDTGDYRRKAVALSSDLAMLSKLRAGLRSRLQASPLLDGDRFARSFGQTLWRMWQASAVS